MQRKNQVGAAAVELALVIPFLFFIFIAAFDFSRISVYGFILSNASRAGALYGSRSDTLAQDRNGIQAAALAEAIDIGNITVSSSLVCRCGSSEVLANCNMLNACSTGTPKAYFVQVQTSSNFTTIFSYLGIPSSIPLTSQTEYRIK